MEKPSHSAGFECQGSIPIPGELVSIIEATPTRHGPGTLTSPEIDA
jgi:hypothetical protein